MELIRSEEDSLNKKTTAVILTANAMEGSRKMYMDAGFDDYLTKPIDSARLLKAVKRYLPEDKIQAPVS